jgi:hypothetical protein
MMIVEMARSREEQGGPLNQRDELLEVHITPEDLVILRRREVWVFLEQVNQLASAEGAWL